MRFFQAACSATQRSRIETHRKLVLFSCKNLYVLNSSTINERYKDKCSSPPLYSILVNPWLTPLFDFHHALSFHSIIIIACDYVNFKRYKRRSFLVLEGGVSPNLPSRLCCGGLQPQINAIVRREEDSEFRRPKRIPRARAPPLVIPGLRNVALTATELAFWD